MFLHTPKKKQIHKNQYTTKINILSPTQLLDEPKRKQWLKNIKETSQFDETSYKKLCIPLIEQVTLYYQQLPETSLYFSEQGGLLNHALSRTNTATELLRQYLLPPPDGALSDEQKRWWYVLFSASLLRNVGILCTDYQIGRYKITGEFIKYWEPLLELIGHLNHQYDYEFLDLNDRAFTQRATILLAQKLMPLDGFSWITSHKSLFAIWLALLNEDREDAKPLDAILDRAEELILQENIIDKLSFSTPSKKTHSSHSFIDPHQASSLPKEYAAGAAFFKWMLQNIERGKFLLNQAPIYAVPGGILICIEAFQQFSKEYPIFKNWKAVQHSFSQLKLHQITSDQGITVPGSLILPNILKTHDQKETTPIQLSLGKDNLRITSDGEWVESLTSTPSLKGHKNG